jgi:chromosome segregation ATPase
MAADPRAQAIGEIVAWLEQQVRESRDETTRTVGQLDQIRRQVHELADEVREAERTVREVDPKLVPLKGVPEKLRSLDEGDEQLRQLVVANRNDVDNALRILRSEGEHDRSERSDAFKRIESANSQLSLLLADIAQVQSQASQVSQVSQTLAERQREIEARVDQFGLRLDRSIEVNKDLEERIRNVLVSEQDERFEVVFERLQVVGEMVKRAEDMIAAASAEKTMRDEVLDEIKIWRSEHSRIDTRLNTLEEAAGKLTGLVDRVQGEITLLEGRHSGLGERVGNIRRDIAEVVDHVREEFAKYNALAEKQRRKQIQVLEQELREMKFHSFHPPEEP